jgi:hypothetical protein
VSYEPPNFERPDIEVPDDLALGIVQFVRAHPFEYTLVELGEEFNVASIAVRQTLRRAQEYLTAIPVQDGDRHVWGHSKAAADEWEYLRRQAGGMVSILRSLTTRMGRVTAKYGPPPTSQATDVAVLVLDLFLALPDPVVPEEGE